MSKQCGMFSHLLVDGVFVRNEKHISFMHKTNRDFRPDDQICLVCKTTMQYMYELKLKRAKEFKKSQGHTLSSVSSTSTDSIDSAVNQTPQHRKLMSKDNDSSSSQTVNFGMLPSLLDDSVIIGTQEDVNPTGSGKSARTSIVENPSLMTASTAVSNRPSKVSFNDELATIRPNAELKNMSNQPVASPTIYTDDAENFSHSINVRLSQQPTTTAAARAEAINIEEYCTPLRANREGSKKTRTPLLRFSASPTARDTAKIIPEQPSTSSRNRPITVHQVGDEVDTTTYSSDDDTHSLNYYDPNVRYPQYQPIPKRREFYHDNPTVMDIYIQGLRGDRR